ncbi:class I SAM-dependent methyltransferase [Bradyrhizobium sp. SYSU BS000235]|uniref:class I SAM-dependent methyltransferase n=1 Tax=Bradyrhizobium sp. SYSU BS000235 TaxID=3411332 RepID=UPI003C782954
MTPTGKQALMTETSRGIGAAVPYVFGHSDSELHRLMRQAAVLTPITRRLLSDAGLARDMRVLDVGCGTGDVSMLVADMVGSGGAVVAIDRSKDALAVARKRAQAAGHDNIEFREGSAEAFTTGVPFDFAIGRYVLVHQPDPVSFIRAIAKNVRPGGVVAFHEPGLYDTRNQTVPPIVLWSQAFDWIYAAFHSVITHPDAGARMVGHFHEAGLKRTPTLFCEIPIGGGTQSPLIGWVVHTLRSLIPQLEKIGVATAQEIDIDTLEDRLRAAAVGSHTQLMTLTQFCGWARL